jgi:hypothetical protein
MSATDSTGRVHVPDAAAERMYEVRDAAHPFRIIPTRTDRTGDVAALVEIDDVDSVIARVPAQLRWVDTATDTGGRRLIRGRTWALVRFHAARRRTA